MAKKLVVYEICEMCGGGGRRGIFRRKCIYCNGTGEIIIPDILASAAFDSHTLLEKKVMRRMGFNVPLTLMRYE